MRRVNVGGTVNVLDAAASAGIGRVVITSTAGVFGPSQGGLVDEATPRAQVPFFNEYESSKAEMHAAVRAKVAEGLACRDRLPRPASTGRGPMVEGNAVTRMVQRYIEGRWRALPGDGQPLGQLRLCRRRHRRPPRRDGEGPAGRGLHPRRRERDLPSVLRDTRRRLGQEPAALSSPHRRR